MLNVHFVILLRKRQTIFPRRAWLTLETWTINKVEVKEAEQRILNLGM